MNVLLIEAHPEQTGRACLLKHIIGEEIMAAFRNKIVICLTCTAFLLLSFATFANAEKKIIKLAYTHQADFASEIHTAAWIFQQWVNENSDTLEVKLYPNNALGQERDVYEGMQLGSGATCSISGTAILNNFNKQVGVLDLPFLWRGYDHVHKVLDGPVGEKLAAGLQKSGFRVIAWMDSWGYRNVVTSKVEVTKPEDIKGLKLRTIPTPIYVAALNAMGANATPMAFGEVYTAMQTGVLDGFEHGASVVKANKFYEEAKYIAMTRHLFGPLAFVYSEKEWDKLSENERDTIMNAATFARDVQRGLAPIREAEAFQFLEDKGMKINDIDTTSFREKATSVQEELADEMGASDLLKMIKETK